MAWFSILVLVVAVAGSAAETRSARQLWVLRGPDQIVEYDATTFAARRTLKVPPRVLEHPEYLSVNGKGQLLFVPPMASAGDRVWFWDGHQAREWTLDAATKRGRRGGKPTITETASRSFLSAGGESLFWFENRFEKVTDESGVERSVRSSSRVWRTDVGGGSPETIARLVSPGWCECATGTCSETCPEWSFWAPDGVVGEAFLVTHLTPGQLGATYHESLLYQRSGRTWRAKKLPQAIQVPLTASVRGEVLIAAIPDGGCCGWENEGNDQMLLLRHGTVSVLYDERDRYDNRNYDVSFYPASARLAAGNAMLAYTLTSTASGSTEVRLSSAGTESAAELARIGKAMAELPAVEVVRLAGQLREATTIPHAVLVGWMSDRGILVTQGGRLAVHDIRGGARQDTAIGVRSAADAFLR